MKLNDITLYTWLVPTGAGASFLGYLQGYYRDWFKPFKEENYPRLNDWGTAFVCDFRPNIKLFPQGTKNQIIRQLEEVDFDVLDDLDNKQIVKNDTIRFINSIKGHDIDHLGNPAILLRCHTFPLVYNLETLFKEVHQAIVVECDPETMLYVTRLKGAKHDYYMDGNAKNIEWKAESVYKHQQIALEKYPPIINVNYKRFFIDIDEEEIKNFFVKTLDLEPLTFKYAKLPNICDMIKAYTKLNKELLNE